MDKASPSILSFFSYRPWILSGVLLISLVLWLASGLSQAHNSPGVKTAEPQAVPLAKVVVETFHVAPVARSISLYGRTAPDRQATLAAQVAGQIETLLVKKGSVVKKGQPLIQLDMADWGLQLNKAKALLAVREKEFTAAKALKKRGLQGEVAFSLAEATLLEARARVRNAEHILTNTQIVAPFDGIIEQYAVEVGDFVSIGDPMATVVDLDPLVIEADVSERHIHKLDLNQVAHVNFIGQPEKEGTLRYISQLASPATNTFAIEIEISNPNNQIPAGISAEVGIELDTQSAIKITPAMLALDESGNLGVKTVTNRRVQDDQTELAEVEFVPIQLVKAQSDGVWLSGFDKQVDIITVGQGFVRDGDSVIAVQQ
ncbi:efflux RND transporter periplasmic adaptor subunit [Vibrio sp. Of7-15]|uniref:efflux RND transporter periplasmic adaptor subunit n=1 Tax=Vibrio sp. Of7-15 TaxID=2724879 RepID=UPI001EF27420|nr:efflux RND transporter periplasmic adaptor subunit [Vibrio sp. Of7-15]MCG7497637.1 efflux RND transporter periplasmic adaptor subunit [Vibrio sp. Of7-15]